MIRGTKRLLLAGASAVAIFVGAAQAEATSYSIPGMYTFITPASGEYAIEAVGAVGGSSQEPPEYGGTSLIPGGPGAEAAGDVFLSAGEHLIIYVGGAGYTATFGNAGDGGGGGSFVWPVLVVGPAGGGGGAGSGFGYVVGNISPGGPGQAGQSGQAGYGGFGGAGGVGGNGGGGGTLILCDGCVGNGGGGRASTAPEGNGAGTASGGGVTLPVGGIGWEGGSYAGGGYGGGGGAGAGGGGGTSYPFYGGGGGGSYLAPAFTNQVLLGGRE